MGRDSEISTWPSEIDFAKLRISDSNLAAPVTIKPGNFFC